MEVILLMTFVFLTVMVLMEQFGPRLREALVQPLYDATKDATMYGLSPTPTPVDPSVPEANPLHPYSSVRNEALHLL